MSDDLELISALQAITDHAQVFRKLPPTAWKGRKLREILLLQLGHILYHLACETDKMTGEEYERVLTWLPEQKTSVLVKLFTGHWKGVASLEEES